MDYVGRNQWTYNCTTIFGLELFLEWMDTCMDSYLCTYGLLWLKASDAIVGKAIRTSVTPTYKSSHSPWLLSVYKALLKLDTGKVAYVCNNIPQMTIMKSAVKEPRPPRPELTWHSIATFESMWEYRRILRNPFDFEYLTWIWVMNIESSRYGMPMYQVNVDTASESLLLSALTVTRHVSHIKDVQRSVADYSHSPYLGCCV